MLGKLWTRLTAPFRNSGLANPAQWLVDWARGGLPTDSNVTVNDKTIMSCGSVYQAVTIIAGDHGQLPLRVMKRLPNGDKERDRLHAGHRLLSRKPNDEMLPSTFKELLQKWALLWGNGCAVIIREGRTPVQLVPLLPDRTTLERGEDGQLWYITKVGKNRTEHRLRPENVLHIMGLSSDGLWGDSVIEQMRNTAGFGMGLLKHGNRLFSRGTRLSGVITRPVDAGKWSVEARQRLRREWRDMHEGLDARESIAVLQDGMSFSPMSISNVDAQWLEAMRLSREQVAQFFSIPPHKLGAMENSSVRANLEEQNRDYLNSTLMRWLVKWEEECNRKLLTPREQETESRFFKWQVAALLRGSIKDRYAAYAVGRTFEWLSANDVLRLEDMNVRADPGGDEYVNPNVKPKPDSKTDDDGQEPPEPAPPKATAHRALVADRCRQLVTVEMQKVRRAAKKGGDFLGWVDSFYDSFGNLAEEYLAPSVASVASAGVATAEPMTVALAHASASRRQLVGLAGVVTSEQLSAQVDQLTEHWPDRVAAMVDAIFQEVRDGQSA